MNDVILSLNPERTMDIVLESLRDLVEYELAVVLSLEDGDTLRVRKAMGPLYTQEIDEYHISLKQRTDLASIIEARQPHLFPTQEHHLDTYHGVLDLPDGHSCLVSPLYLKEKAIGLLTLDHRVCNMFTPGIVRFIGTLSRLISIALVQSDATLDLHQRNRVLLEERNYLLDNGSGALRELIGSSDPWLRVLDGIRLVAGTDVPVLLQGETGTGKELAARVLHRLSSRTHRPFVAVNCSALTASLAESELFGHEKGAFTGAHVQRKGRFELADSGTLFLDEIGDLPLEIQPKLLRAIQEGVFERVGGERPVPVDVRIITATHVDLNRAVRERTFREDLFYRLNVFPLQLPPLRDRREDIIPLAHRFLESIRERPGFSGVSFAPETLETLLERRWPGNVRELRNVVERSSILSRGGRILPEHLIVATDVQEGPQALLPPGSADRNPVPLDAAIRRHIVSALDHADWRIYGSGGAAHLLGLKPSTLQSKMQKLGIRRTG